MIEENTLLNLW